jgi:hypothetical protein
VNAFLKNEDTPAVGEITETYVMTTESDLAPKLFRSWWKKHVI